MPSSVLMMICALPATRVTVTVLPDAVAVALSHR
jgi:hypothetical protein